MESIRLSADQVRKIKKGEKVKVKSDELDQTVEIQLSNTSIDVDVVQSVEQTEKSNSSKFSVEDNFDSSQSVSELKSQLVNILTEKKKLQKRIDSLREDIDSHNKQIRTAKKMERDDLARKAQDKKTNKLDKIKDLNGQVNDLKEDEHRIRDRIDVAQS